MIHPLRKIICFVRGHRSTASFTWHICDGCGTRADGTVTSYIHNNVRINIWREK